MSQPSNQPHQRLSSTLPSEPAFYYFAYGSCMCPVDLQRSLGEPVYAYVIGRATLKDHRLGFYRRSPKRNCGTLDVVQAPGSTVEGVLYCLPWRLSDRLDEREEVPRGGYRHETVTIDCCQLVYADVRTYVVLNKLSEELAPNDWYFSVVMRGAVTCGLPEQYCWNLFHHMHGLQQQSLTRSRQPIHLKPFSDFAGESPNIKAKLENKSSGRRERF